MHLRILWMTRPCTTYLRADGCGCFDSIMESPAPESQPPQAVAKELALSEGEPAWQRLLDRLPGLKSQFKQASACQPFRHMPAISFRSSTIAGKRWAMLPSAAGFVDPLLSTGFALTLMGIERLAQIIHKHRDSADLGAATAKLCAGNGMRLAGREPADRRAVRDHGQLSGFYRGVALIFCRGQLL